MVWCAVASSTESGMLVGPGLAKNWRPRGLRGWVVAAMRGPLGGGGVSVGARVSHEGGALPRGCAGPRVFPVRDVVRRDESEGHGGPEGDAAARVVAAHDRGQVVARCVR